jgi:phosphatidate cytidylyltransferase
MLSTPTDQPDPAEENPVPTGEPASEPADAPAPTTESPATAPGKAGRNLPAAIGVGVLLGAAVLVALLTVRHVFVGIAAVAVAVGTVEFAGALRRAAGIQVALWPVLIGGQAMVWLSWPFERNGVFAAFLLTILACLVWRFRGGIDGYVRDVGASILTAAYVPLFASFAAMLVVAPDGTQRVLCFLILVVCSDTGGYIVGRLFGRHKMAPTISPGKTWQGFGGSMAAGLLAGWLSVTLLLDGQWWHGLIFGAALVISATVGDLVESLIKRDLGIKDMGDLLPGHGGVMDRLDSLLPSAVVAWLLLRWFVPA